MQSTAGCNACHKIETTVKMRHVICTPLKRIAKIAIFNVISQVLYILWEFLNQLRINQKSVQLLPDNVETDICRNSSYF